MTHGARKHTCPHCGKHWPCLAEDPPRYRDGRPSRPITDCIYPEQFVCAPCAREGER